MKKFVINIVKVLGKAVAYGTISALATLLGISTTGCIAIGDNASACCVPSAN